MTLFNEDLMAHCCGIGTIWNFSLYESQSDKVVLEDLKSYKGRRDRGAWMCSITEHQAARFEPLLLEAGWKRTLIGVRNPNTRNLVTVYTIRTFESEKKLWETRFPRE